MLFVRPIAGHANLCPKSISTKPQELDTLISTVKHEILHALGFSVSLYAFYRDDHGNPLTPRDNKGKPPLNAEYVIHLLMCIINNFNEGKENNCNCCNVY